MAAKKKSVKPDVEYPRGEIEILAPGESVSPRPGAFPFESAARSGTYAFRTYAFKAQSSGVLGVVAVVAGVSALFLLAASAFVVVASVAVIGVAGLYLRGQLRRWLDRGASSENPSSGRRT